MQPLQHHAGDGGRTGDGIGDEPAASGDGRRHAHAAPGDAALAGAVRFFEELSPASLERIAAVYAPDARFVDPFNDLRGPPAIAAVFAHMFAQLDAPRFRVRDRFARGDQGFVTWDFEFRFRRGSPRGTQSIHGSTHFRFDPQGRILLHRDYWDAAGELYEKLPVIGAPLRWLRRRLATPEGG